MLCCAAVLQDYITIQACGATRQGPWFMVPGTASSSAPFEVSRLESRGGVVYRTVHCVNMAMSSLIEFRHAVAESGSARRDGILRRL